MAVIDIATIPAMTRPIAFEFLSNTYAGNEFLYTDIGNSIRLGSLHNNLIPYLNAAWLRRAYVLETNVTGLWPPAGSGWTPDVAAAGIQKCVISDSSDPDFVYLTSLVGVNENNNGSYNNANMPKYGEFHFSGATFGAANIAVGIMPGTQSLVQSGELGKQSGSWAFTTYTTTPPGTTTNLSAGSIGWYSTGELYEDNIVEATFTTYTASDIIGVAVDLTNNAVRFSKNGLWQYGSGAEGSVFASAYVHTPTTFNYSLYARSTAPFYEGVRPAFQAYSGTTGLTVDFKAYPGTFTYAPPTGYFAWGLNGWIYIP